MRKLLFLIIMTVLCPSFYSCSNEDDEEVAEAYYHDMELRHLLYGEYVMFTKVTVNSVDKTLLEGGCPTRVVFDWVGDSLVFSIPEMQIGNMPFPISFKANCVITSLNSWEADEHAGGNTSWFKFVGTNGYVSMGDSLKPNGSSIKGYFNPDTKVIEFEIDYNVMNVRTICERQVLDVERTRDYDVEMEKYMKALNEKKKENGLDVTPPSNTKDDSDVPSSPGAIVSLNAIKGMLQDDIVLNSDVTVGGRVMAQSVPTIVNFKWSGDVMSVKLENLSIGRMPFALNFSCESHNVEMTEEELSKYSAAWYKFSGNGGAVSSTPSMPSVSGNEGEVVCYFNPSTMQIALNINFNTSGAIASFDSQVIDYTRIDNYDKELEEYQKSK